jgi:hypothetical protein
MAIFARPKLISKSTEFVFADQTGCTGIHTGSGGRLIERSGSDVFGN